MISRRNCNGFVHRSCFVLPDQRKKAEVGGPPPPAPSRPAPPPPPSPPVSTCIRKIEAVAEGSPEDLCLGRHSALVLEVPAQDLSRLHKSTQTRTCAHPPFLLVLHVRLSTRLLCTLCNTTLTCFSQSSYVLVRFEKDIHT